MYDAVVIGGGFYGCVIAVYLARERGLRRIMLVEREASLMSRASYSNQARIHNGYHYPRSLTTAWRSRVNFPRFIEDWPQAAMADFLKVYAIARRGSKVTARQFERFCQEIGARLRPADRSVAELFHPALIERAYLVEEHAFDTRKLAAWADRELAACGVTVCTDTTAGSVKRTFDDSLAIVLEPREAGPVNIRARYVFNCTYSGINQLGGDFRGIQAGVKHEVTEMALIQMPPILSGLGVTVMDGPYFSAMPFPARGLHTLSHVRYTPHFSWQDAQQHDPYGQLAQYDKQSRVGRMLRDAARYMPAMAQARYVDSLFEVKTVLLKNEGDDGRPILFERSRDLPNFYSVLGGKIDNIYDILERLDAENFEPLEQG